MIHAVRADRDSFKDVEFGSGFNVVIAERDEDARDKDSRNGSGKSSLLEVIHFCLGSGFDKSTLRAPELRGWTFSLEFDIRGRRVTASRNTERPNQIVLKGDLSGWPVDLKREADAGYDYVALKHWTDLLAWALFDLPMERTDAKFGPSSRALLSFFVRRGRDAFSTPFSYLRSQPGWSKQVNTAFLLGLDWRYPQRAIFLTQEKDRLQKAKTAVRDWRSGLAGLSGEPQDTRTLEGELEGIQINLERALRASETRLAEFQVHPEYKKYEIQASEVTARIHNLVNENVVAREMLDFYQSSLTEEDPGDPEALAALYEEVDVYFSELVTKRLEDVQAFHRRISANRRQHLQAEIGRISAAIEHREEKERELSEERGRALRFLREYGALEEFTRLQESHNEEAERLATVKAQLDELRGFEEKLGKVRMETDQLILDARADFEERRPIWTDAVDLFGANTAALYEEPGTLALNVSATGGLSHSTEIQSGDSQGVQEMVVLCYDLMLAQRWASADSGPFFVIHDSTIFDGVDERQAARALVLAQQRATESSFQYICCLNSDGVPWTELPNDFDLRDHLKLELSDQGDDGGLFGIRF